MLILLIHQRIVEENRRGKAVDSEDEDDEIGEELEGANDSLNLLDNAVLDQLPCLASSSVPSRRGDCSTPTRSDTQRREVKIESRLDQCATPGSSVAHEGVSMATDGTRKAVLPNAGPKDDVVVLSFSSPGSLHVHV